MVKRSIGILFTGQLLLLVFLMTAVSADEWQTETARQLKQRLQPFVVSTIQDCRDPRFDLFTAMVRFYQYRRYEPAWVDRYGLLPEGAMSLAAVKQAGSQGLLYADYHHPLLDDLLDGIVTRPVVIGAAFNGKQVQLDLVVTEMILRYAWHRTMGRSDPTIAHFGATAGKSLSRDLALALAESLDNGRLEDFLEQLGPRHAAYRMLQKKLPHYLRIKAAGGWPTIADGEKLQHGDCRPRVIQLKERLARSGDILPPTETTASCFDDRLEAAVARFQRRHGLHADGVVGGRTLAALNVPVEARIHQIQLNLERWRWMPDDLGSRYLLVNIPGFQMQVVEAGQTVKTLRTIVGRKKRPTPVLSSKITYLEINPYWYVPSKIAREDLLPKIKANPEFLVHQNFRVYDSWDKNARELDPLSIDWTVMSADHFTVRLRQEPAGHNALGRVKFMFPNDLSVYIHDTPSKRLFNRSSRPFSSGCIRVEKPLELVSLLLNHREQDQDWLTEAVASNQRQVVTLPEPVPVYLVYLTAWVTPDGESHFRDDVYGHDLALQSALADSAAVRQTCASITSLPTYLGEL